MRDAIRALPLRGRTDTPTPLHWRLQNAHLPADAPLVVCLHGIRMNEDLFAVLLSKLFDLPLRFLLLRGPIHAEPLAGQGVGASWYDYDGDPAAFSRALAVVETQVLDAIAGVERQHGLSPRAHVLLGFSQGGYCGAVLALRNPDRFDGLVVSGARVKSEILGDDLPRAAASGMRVLLCQGRGDTHVPPEGAERGLAALTARGVSTELAWFEAGHSVGRAQVTRIRDWLDEHFTLRDGREGREGREARDGREE